MKNNILRQSLYIGESFIVGEKMYQEMQKWRKEDFEHDKSIQNVIGWYKGIPVYKN